MWSNFFYEFYIKNIDLLSNFLYYYSVRKNIEERHKKEGKCRKWEK